MDIASPLLLWLLLALPLLGWWLMREERALAAREATLGEVGVLDGAKAGADRARRRRGRLALVCAYALFVVGLAGPRIGAKTELLPRRGLDLVFAVDVSQSMRARDVRPDRLERVKAEISATLDDLGENRVGLVAFAGSAFVQCPLTTDVEAMRAFLKVLAPDVVPQGGTAIASGLLASAHMFEAESEANPELQKSGRVVVVFSDGEDHEGGVEDAAKALKAQGANVVVIGVGSGLGEPIPVVSSEGAVIDYLKDKRGNTVMSRMSPDTLSSVAQLTDGRFIDGTKEADLGMSYVAGEVARLEKRELEARVRTSYVDRSHWPLALGLLFLMFGLTYPERRRPGAHARAPAPMGAAVVLLLCAASTASAQDDDDGPLFSRPEPSILEGVEALRRQDHDAATEAYRRAQAKEREQRAVVEYNVGAALLDKARRLKEQGATDLPADPTAPVEDPAAPVYEEAQGALSRAFDLSSDRALRSDAALAQGNALAESGDLKGAVKSYRRAVTEDPTNGRAIQNLRSALRMLRAQPPPPPSEGGDEDEKEEGDEGDEEQEGKQEEQSGSEDENEDGEKKEGEQGEGQGDDNQQERPKDDDGDKDPKGEQQQGENQEGDEDKKDQQQQGEGQDQGGQEKKDEQAPQDQKGEGGDDENKDEDQKPGQSPTGGDDEGDEKKKGPAPGEEEGDKKKDARRLLDAMRQKEKPLHPFQMRNQKSRLLPPEKPW